MHFKRVLPVVVALIVVIAAFTRLWNIPGTLQFLGDQGRDAIIVSDIFTKFDPVFIGPVTSVGNMYLGPFYYYFMMPFLLMSYPSPVGPAYAVGLLGVITVYLVFYLGRALVGEKAAVVGAGLMALSSTATIYTRFSWNPNPAPLVALLMIYATYYAWKKNAWAWVAVAFCFSILAQLHYLTLLSAAGAGLIWLLALQEKITKQQLLATLVGGLVFIASLTPLILFDATHNWLNAQGFSNMLFGSEEAFAREDTTLPAKIAKSIKETHGRGMHILLETTVGKERTANTVFLVIFVGILGFATYTALKKDKHHGKIVLASYLGTGIIGTAVYEHSIFDHYIAYLFPVTFLTLGYGLTWMWQRHLIGKVIAVGFSAWFLIYNIPRMPLQTAGWTITDMKAVSQTIYDRVDENEKYNIVLLSETGDIDGQNYRYFLHVTDKPPVPLEQRGAVDTLFIINEDRELEKVTDSPVYEIVVFPDKDPKEVYTIPGGPEITVLRKEKG
jgi:4-amino-4-deoxy-L-arabinose transferase-like glycosyltransferase